MKIVQFIDTKGVGGAEVVLMECVRGLRRQHEDVEVWHLGSDWLASACEEAGVPHREVWWPGAYKKALLLPVFLVLLLIQLYRHKVDAIHSHIYTAVVSVGMITPFAPVSHTGTLHDTWFLQTRGAWRRFLLRLVSSTGSKIAVISNDMCSQVSEALGKPLNKFYVVYNGTDTQRYHPKSTVIQAENQPVRQSTVIQAENQPVRLLCVARLIARKRIDLLIAATNQLIVNGCMVKTQIVGGGELAGELQRVIDDGGLSGSVELMGEHDDIPDILRGNDVFVLPSDDEGLPCSIIEAMACSLPIVASDVGGVSELVKSGKNGYLFPSGDVNELVKVLKKLIDDSSSRIQFGDSSRQIVERNFSTEVMVRRYLELYTL